MRRLLVLAFLFVWTPAAPQGQQGQSLAQGPELRLPLKQGSVKFAVIGDTGTGDSHQLAVAKQLANYRAKFPFEFVTMLGDNIYGGDGPKDYDKKFAVPYKPLLDGGVKFYAALGNHDNPNQRLYKPFNMGGERYYDFKPGKDVHFFALDSNYVDDKQIDWLDKALARSGSEWKIMFFHHPLYSSGETHGSADLQRERLEPIFTKYGVNVVLTGHEHFYERIKPQKGIAYFIVGSSAKLRKGDILQTNLTAKGWDQSYAFILMEIVGDELFFQTISDKAQTIDAGSIRRVETPTAPGRTTQPVVPGAAAPKQPATQPPASSGAAPKASPPSAPASQPKPAAPAGR